MINVITKSTSGLVGMLNTLNRCATSLDAAFNYIDRFGNTAARRINSIDKIAKAILPIILEEAKKEMESVLRKGEGKSPNKRPSLSSD